MKKTVVRAFSLPHAVSAWIDSQVRAGLPASKVVKNILEEAMNGKAKRKRRSRSTTPK